MTGWLRGLLVCAVAAVPLAFAARPATAQIAPRYRIVELATPAGYTSAGNAINNAGVVVGTVTDPSGRPRATRWSATGAATDLGLLPGGSGSVANGVNDSGQATGSADRTSGGFAYPVRWSAAGVIQDLGGPATNRLGTGSAIDPAGRVAGGQRPIDSQADPLGILYGVDGTPTELGPAFGLARGINGYGQVVGGPGYVWRDGAATSLPNLPDGTGSVAYAINNGGDVVGTASVSDGLRAVRWRGGAVSDIGTVDGIRFSTAKAVNAAGQVVGTADPMCFPCVAPRAWIWQPGTAITPLDTLLPAGSGWTLREANGINDRGEIVGVGLHGGVARAYRLSPVFAVGVNFQPAGAAVPPGYVADTGATFGSRGSGRAFGWNVDNTANARDRNAPASPDQRYDTLTHMQKAGGATVWEIAVPVGTYIVHVVAGDPAHTDSTYRITVEGLTAVSGPPSVANRWLEGTVRVLVTDGRLTVANGAGAVNNKLNMIDVVAT